MTDADIAAAMDAFMADPSTSAFLFGEGYRIDLAKAVRTHEWASVTTANKDATDHLKRAAVRTAILLARAEKVGCLHPTQTRISSQLKLMRDRSTKPASHTSSM